MGRRSRTNLTLLVICVFLSSKQFLQNHDNQQLLVSVPDQSHHTDLPIISDPIVSLSYLASLPPPVPPSPTCSSPPPLPPPTTCPAATNTALTGERLHQPRQLVMMIMFGFEVDTLEIALREQLEYLDKVFIVESTLNQKGVKQLF